MSSVYVLEPPTVGKVVLTTSLGDLDIELWPKEAPKAVSMESEPLNSLLRRQWVCDASFLVASKGPVGLLSTEEYNFTHA